MKLRIKLNCLVRMLLRLLWESVVSEADDLVAFPSDQNKTSPWYYFHGYEKRKQRFVLPLARWTTFRRWLVEHFAILLSIEERDFLKEVCKTFKARTISGKRSPNVSDYYLLSYILKNADFLDMNNFSLLIELTFAVSPSTAHVERSFSFPAWGYAQ